MATTGTAPPRVEERVLRRALGVGATVGLIYFSISGGPYGLEGVVGESGAGMALVLIVVTPLLVSLPAALMVAELGTTMPVEGGYYHWVKTGLGPFWGFQEGWWSWIVSWVDLAIYPVLFVAYAAYFFPDQLGEGADPWVRWAVAVAVVWVFGVVNIRGTKLVGDTSKAFTYVVIAPFVVLTVVGLVKLAVDGGSNPFEPFTLDGDSAGAAFAAGLWIVMWNYIGWDGISTVAEEIERPQRTLPRALAISIPLITVVYLLPVVVTLSLVGVSGTPWEEGSFTDFGRQIGGPVLGWAMAAVALVSAVGLFSAWLLSYSRIPFALADDGYLPARLSDVHPRFHTPWRSIVVACVICTVFVWGGFEDLVVIDVIVYTAAILLQVAALVNLRRKHPELARPFRIRGGWWGIAAVVVVPCVVYGVGLYYLIAEEGWWRGGGWSAVALLTGVVLYPFARWYKARSGRDRTWRVVGERIVSDDGRVAGEPHPVAPGAGEAT